VINKYRGASRDIISLHSRIISLHAGGDDSLRVAQYVYQRIGIFWQRTHTAREKYQISKWQIMK